MQPVRFGLIGYGAWGSHHARALAGSPEVELKAIAVPSEASRQAARTAHPTANIYSCYQDLLAREDLDAVDVVLPSDLHLEVGQAVLNAGRHLLLEKPMALSLDHCDRLTSLARERGKVLAIGHELRHSPLWGKVQEMIHAGAVCDPLYLLIELWRRPYRRGAQGWRYDRARVGNWILEEPIHFFDLARWYLAKAGEPESVFARANSAQPGHPELQDNFSAILTFPAGRYAVISQTLAAFEHHQTVKLTGTRGALWASWSGALDRDLRPSFSLKYHDGTSVSEVQLTGLAGEVFELQEEVKMMARAIRDGTPVAADGNDGRWAVALCLAAERSAVSGQAVCLKTFLGERRCG